MGLKKRENGDKEGDEERDIDGEEEEEERTGKEIALS